MTEPEKVPGRSVAGAPDEAALDTVEAVIRHRVSEVLGGWYGSVETAAPTVAFVLVWLLRDDVRGALLAAAAVTILLLGVRLALGGPVRYVLSSVLATALAAFFALRSGRAEDAFLPGILASAAYLVAALVSVAARWPLVGFVVGAGDPAFAEDPTAWRRDRQLVRVCSRLTWVLVGLFAVRLAVMVPLYLAGEVAWLGVAKIALGWPLYLLAIVVMGLMLATGHTPVTRPGPTGTAGRRD